MVLGLLFSSFLFLGVSRFYLGDIGSLNLSLSWLDYLNLIFALVLMLLVNHVSSMYIGILEIDAEMEGKTVQEILDLCEGPELARRDDLIDFLALAVLRDPRFLSLQCSFTAFGSEQFSISEFLQSRANQRVNFSVYAHTVQDIVMGLLNDKNVAQYRLIRYLNV